MDLLLMCAVDELDDGEVLQVDPDDGEALAVYKIDGEFFVTSDTCTHGDAPLSLGEIDEVKIICPFHMGSFNIKTGEVIDLPCEKPLRTYPVVVKDGSVYADISDNT